MKICSWCNEKFALSEAEDEFEIEESLFSYRNIKLCLCGKCAIQAVEDEVDGVYFETCEQCGKRFDVFVDSAEFSNHFSAFNGTTLFDYWDNQILCCDCALSEAEE